MPSHRLHSHCKFRHIQCDPFTSLRTTKLATRKHSKIRIYHCEEKVPERHFDALQARIVSCGVEDLIGRRIS